MLKVTVNEKVISIDKKDSLFTLKDKLYPDADVIIINGFQINVDTALKENDKITFIKKGVIPTAKELEYLMSARHTPAVQDKIRDGEIIICGLGGLGSNIAISLARMGVGKICGIDFDVVEPSNLNRQQYFIDQIGMKKIDALLQTLKRINPYIKYDMIDLMIDDNSSIIFDKIITKKSIIIEAFDNPQTKLKLFQYISANHPNNFYIGASGVAGIYMDRELNIKKIGKKAFIVGDEISNAKPGEGLMSTRVGIAANIQANIAVNIIVNGDL